jgi:hypothetical protein
MTNERPPLRIGTAERTAAMKALDEHLAAGRLQVEEYGERSALAASATTAPELAALFDDLPAPHPPLPGIRPPEAPWGGPPVAPVPAAPVRPEPTGMQLWGPRLVLLAPLLAVALFVLTRQWVFFLLIPALGMVWARHQGHGHHGGGDR